MKKYLLFLFLIAFILPSIALASWWNPFSWFGGWSFNKTEVAPPVQVEKQKTPEEQIAELQKQLDDLKNSKDASVAIPMPVTKKETVKNALVIDNSEIIKKQVQAQLEAAIKAKAEQDALVASQNLQNTETQTVVEENNSDVIFNIIHVGQTIYKEPYVYGSYGITIEVEAGKEDIFIPKSTTDSTIIYTGFGYSLIGDSFRGDQSSEIGCGTTTTINDEEYCKINRGKSSTITTTVWLTPEQSGNYGIMFENINYLRGINHEEGSFDVNKGTQKIYLQS